MSHAAATERMPRERRCASASDSPPSPRAVIATAAPASPSASLICSPSPRLPPVTSATLPSSRSRSRTLLVCNTGVGEVLMTTQYRADQVGSFLRPQAVKDAHVAYAQGRLPLEELRQIEDAAILEVLDLQRQVGVDILSDGE